MLYSVWFAASSMVGWGLIHHIRQRCMMLLLKGPRGVSIVNYVEPHTQPTEETALQRRGSSARGGRRKGVERKSTRPSRITSRKEAMAGECRHVIVEKETSSSCKWRTSWVGRIEGLGINSLGMCAENKIKVRA